MKVWTGYGSEHSARLVMLGKFKTAEDASDFLGEVEKLEQLVQAEDGDAKVLLRFPKKILDMIFSGEIRFCSDFEPKDLNDFCMELQWKQQQDDTTILEFRSDVTGWAGLIKMLLNAGARIEIFDEHNTES